MKPKSDLQMLLYMKRIEQKRIAEVLGRTQQCISLWLKNPTVKQRELIINAILQIEKERNHEQDN